MGYLDRAVENAVASVELANRLAHPQSIAYAILWVGCVHHARGEYADSCPHLELAMALSREHNLPQILEWGRIMRGSVLTHLGRASEGIFEMRKSLDRQRAMYSLIERSYCLTLLAEALAREGDYTEALALCDEAAEFARLTEGRCYESETHRVRAEILFSLGDQEQLRQVEAELERAIHVARGAQCRLLELRAAISYFRLQDRLGDDCRGRAALAGLAIWFAQESNSPTLLEARQLST
jgi:ATP/maltotriose-dependent transcriptional regulator MalT